MTYKKMSKFIIAFILLSNLLYLLVPRWAGSRVANTYQTIQMFDEKYSIPLVIVNFLLAATFILLNQKYIIRKDIIFFLPVICFYTMSVLINGGGTGIFSCMAMPIYYIFMLTSQRYKIPKWLPIVFLVLLLWVIIPLVDFFISSSDRRLMFFTGNIYSLSGFTGYAIHKNVYAFIIGISILLSFKLNFNKLIRLIVLSFLFGVLLFSQCKSVIVALFAVYIITYITKHDIRFNSFKSLFLLIITIIVGVVSFVKLSFFDDPERMGIIVQFISFIHNNLWFGAGKTVLMYDGLELNPAHNFIIQGIADYGIISLVFFLIFLLYIYRKQTIEFKQFLVYIVVVGLFQPYFKLAIPTEYIIITFLIPCLLKSK